jgi:hypothetical protein
VLLASRILIALVFAVSAISKLRGASAFRSFESATGAMGVPARLVRPAAVTVVAAEVAAALLVALPPGGLVGLSVTVGLLIAFSVGIALALRRGSRASCACFGSSTSPIGRRHLVRNGLLLLVATAGIVGALTGTAPVGLAGIGIVAVAAAVCAALLTRMDDLVALFVSDPLPTPGSSTRPGAIRS